MDEKIVQELLHVIEKQIESFEREKLLERSKNRNLGIIYTPNHVVDYIVSNILRLYFQEFFNSLNINQIDITSPEMLKKVIRNHKIKENLIIKIKSMKILDPSCGSGRFLISIAEKLYKIYQTLEPELSNFEIKKTIIQTNLYGIEIENSAIIISKLRLIKWLLSTNVKSFSFDNFNLKSLRLGNIYQIIEKMDLSFKIFNLDFLLEFNFNKFDIIIGNPPYVENKKIKDGDFKKKLTTRYKTAYRLFDLSILFIERALELLENNGFLSFLLPNKFLSADYGIKLRLLLLNECAIKEIINMSSLPIFQNTATYPITLSLKKTKPRKKEDIIIKIFNQMTELTEDNEAKTIKFNQHLINNLPSKVIPLSGNIELITYLYRNFNTFAETFKDLKIIYRPFGFLKYSKHFDNISDKPKSEKDLLLIGTGNVEKYHIKFKKRIRIAGKDIKISYFNYHHNFEHNWKDLSSEKLIFREIAKDLTCCYDPGVFSNITGLYFIKIPSVNTDQLFSILTILNSQFMNSIFKTLFSTLHMAGGYLRFNGSFIKRLPLPRKFPIFLSQLGKILQLLSQLKYDLDSYESESIKKTELEKFKCKYYNEITIFLNFFNKLSNSIVKLLFLDEFYLKSNLNYNKLRDLLDLKIETLKIPFKFVIPIFEVKNYKIFTLNELDSILSEINRFYNRLFNNKDLLIQLDNIIRSNLS
ncbi:MAG: class I SAM-dependent DNA methyltransferase [Promethearchaeota archaeon]